tara:strand:- start:132 stop:1172 length:1041 start_codon:yes stop_codon:yes gene_type:complete
LDFIFILRIIKKSMNEFIIILLFFIFNFVILLSYKKISKFVNVYDIPNKRKIHKNKTPLIGGVLIIICLILIFFTNIFFNISNQIFGSDTTFYFFFFTSLIIFLLGFVDDKYDLNSNLRLLILSLIIFSILFLDQNIQIKVIKISFLDDPIYLGKYSIFFSTLCFLLFINACNMFDGINLQSTSYFIIVLISLSLFTGLNIFLIIILLSLIAIFYLNFSGKIFMGDSGIYLLSFIFSYLVVKSYNLELIKNADIIFIIMMVPGFDMLRLFISRIFDKKNPFRADMNHIHHLLIKKYSYTKSILIINSIILFPIFVMLLGFNNLVIILSYLVFYIYFIYHLKLNNNK